MRLVPTFDGVVNVAILATCAVLATVALTRQYGQEARRLPDVPHLRLGATATPLKGVDYRASSGTLLLYVNSRCQYCTNSMPFYRALAGEMAKSGRLRFVAVGNQPEAELEAYLRAQGLSIPWALGLSEQATPTPALALVDANGVVKKTWIGQQDPQGEADIRKALASS